MTDRRHELTERLAAVRARIAAAAHAAGRDPSDVTLVAITKTHPASDVALLAELGITDVGENRDQEASIKRRVSPSGLRWHMVGRLQSNKARSVAEWADVVQSLDRVGLVAPLAAGAERAGKRLGVLLQVSLDADPDRGGALAKDLPSVASAVEEAPELELLGLMAVAPLGADARAAFARLAEIREGFVVQHPSARILSAGMSGDLEAAVAAGATHVRIGTALLGDRPPVVR